MWELEIFSIQAVEVARGNFFYREVESSSRFFRPGKTLFLTGPPKHRLLYMWGLYEGWVLYARNGAAMRVCIAAMRHTCYDIMTMPAAPIIDAIVTMTGPNSLMINVIM